MKMLFCLPLLLGAALPVCQELSPGTQAINHQTEDMASAAELVPTHFPARRAAKVAQHYLNTQHGSPLRVYALQQVHRATAQDVDAGRRYSLDFSVTEWASSRSVFRCAAVVTFSSDQTAPPDVQLQCEDLLKMAAVSPQEEEFYHQHLSSAVSAQDIPDSYGNMSKDMEPFWHLAGVAASTIMLRESRQDTEFNMAQVASVTQQETREQKLSLKYHVLLHDIVSQEIIHWRLSCSWSPDGGVSVTETQRLPKCPHDNTTAPDTSTEP